MTLMVLEHLLLPGKRGQSPEWVLKLMILDLMILVLEMLLNPSFTVEVLPGEDISMGF